MICIRFCLGQTTRKLTAHILIPLDMFCFKMYHTSQFVILENSLFQKILCDLTQTLEPTLRVIELLRVKRSISQIFSLPLGKRQ